MLLLPSLLAGGSSSVRCGGVRACRMCCARTACVHCSRILFFLQYQLGIQYSGYMALSERVVLSGLREISRGEYKPGACMQVNIHLWLLRHSTAASDSTVGIRKLFLGLCMFGTC